MKKLYLLVAMRHKQVFAPCVRRAKDAINQTPWLAVVGDRRIADAVERTAAVVRSVHARHRCAVATKGPVWSKNSNSLR